MKQRLPDLDRAINDIRKLAKDYERAGEPNTLLVERLSALERNLLDEFYKSATHGRPAKKARGKKPEKTEKTEVSKLPGA